MYDFDKKKLNEILDNIGYAGLGYGHYECYPSFIAYENIYHNRAKAIKKELERFDIIANVHRHHLFGIAYIVVQFDREANGFISEAEERISRILKIPKEWIGMVTCCDPQMYFIKEKEFMKQYPSANSGTIRFEEDNDEV